MTLDLLAEVSGLDNTLSYHSQRHSVLAANLANADTPNYAPKDVSFSEALQSAPLMQTSDRHLGGSAGSKFELKEVSMERHFDGSGVEIEQAMAQVTANRMRYETGIELTRRRLAMLRYAASNGGNG
jgi:flagellar basal-body rod protein FlgB